MPLDVETAPEINAAEYVSGGYRLARVSKRAEYMSPQLLPDNILSACDCICDFFPDS